MKNEWNKTLIAAAAAALLVSHSQAEPLNSAITWGPATTIAGDTDVDTTGTLLYAYHFGWSPVANSTVNGVTFQGVSLSSSATSTYSFGGNSITEITPGYTIHPFDFRPLTGPSGNLSPGYQGLVGMLASSDSAGTLRLTLAGLTPGNQYEFQWWSSFPGTGGPPYANTWDQIQAQASGIGNAVVLNANVSGTYGGLGQYAIGTFTAVGSAEVIELDNLSANASAYQWGPVINALQMRDLSVSVPEPSTRTK